MRDLIKTRCPKQHESYKQRLESTYARCAVCKCLRQCHRQTSEGKSKETECFWKPSRLPGNIQSKQYPTQTRCMLVSQLKQWFQQRSKLSLCGFLVLCMPVLHSFILCLVLLFFFQCCCKTGEIFLDQPVFFLLLLTQLLKCGNRNLQALMCAQLLKN